MLGRLRMTVASALATFASLATNVYGSRRPLNFNQFSHRKLERAIQAIVRIHCPDSSTRRDGLDRFLDPEREQRRVCHWFVHLGNLFQD